MCAESEKEEESGKTAWRRRRRRVYGRSESIWYINHVGDLLNFICHRHDKFAFPLSDALAMDAPSFIMNWFKNGKNLNDVVDVVHKMPHSVGVNAFHFMPKTLCAWLFMYASFSICLSRARALLLIAGLIGRSLMWLWSAFNRLGI